jgi:multidrug efflux system outer membrane protein
VVAVAALSVAGCSLAPDYQRPALAAPPAYKEAGPWQPAGTAVAATGRWWQAFRDPVLDDLEGQIEAGNFDLAAAAARYAEARAVARQADAARLPEVDIGAGAGRDRVSADRPLGGGKAATYDDYRVGASLSYEIDLFGRVRNGARAAGDRAEASAADLAAARLGLQAQLATLYFTMRELDARIALLNQTVASYQRAFDLTDTRHGGGISSGIDVRPAFPRPCSNAAPISPPPNAASPPPTRRSASPAPRCSRASRSAPVGGTKQPAAPCSARPMLSGRSGRSRPRWRSSTAAGAAPAYTSPARNMTRPPPVIVAPC